jgi:hypothetical protein
VAVTSSQSVLAQAQHADNGDGKEFERSHGGNLIQEVKLIINIML